MSQTRRITVNLSEELAARLQFVAETAGFATVEAVIVESLQMQLAGSRYDGSDPDIEIWLREQVLPTLERRDREGSHDIPEHRVLEVLRQRRQARKSAA